VVKNGQNVNVLRVLRFRGRQDRIAW